MINQLHEFNDSGGLLICNSGWLVDRLKKEGIDSKLCYAGLDLDFWKDYDCRYSASGYVDGFKQASKEHVVIGGLWHAKHYTKNYWMFEDLIKSFSNNNKITFKTLGNTLNDKELRAFYNECDIWISTSELEGFHQVPAEAALCGCMIYYYDIDSGGTRDYCNEETGQPFKDYDDLYNILISERNCLGDSFYYVDNILNMKSLLFDKIGNRKNNMYKFVEMLK